MTDIDLILTISDFSELPVKLLLAADGSGVCPSLPPQLVKLGGSEGRLEEADGGSSLGGNSKLSRRHLL